MADAGGGIVHFEGSGRCSIAVTAEVFEQFVRHHLVLHLNRGDVVIWEKVLIHHREAVRLVEAAGRAWCRVTDRLPDNWITVSVRMHQNRASLWDSSLGL